MSELEKLFKYRGLITAYKKAKECEQFGGMASCNSYFVSGDFGRKICPKTKEIIKETEGFGDQFGICTQFPYPLSTEQINLIYLLEKKYEARKFKFGIKIKEDMPKIKKEAVKLEEKINEGKITAEEKIEEEPDNVIHLKKTGTG